jgi:hypothetical protein
MNRNSPVPWWVVLSIAVVLVGGIYVLAQRTVVQPAPNVVVRQPTLVPRPSVTATATPSAAAEAASPAVSPTPLASAESVPSDWKTYRNTKYGYKIRYPQNWFVSTPGGGEAVESDGTESGVTISEAGGESGIDIQVDEFGTSDMGTGQFKNAKDLDAFIKLFRADPSTWPHLRFVKRDVFGGQTAVWFSNCADAYHPQNGCTPMIYAQYKNYLFEITGDAATDLPTTNSIIDSMTFDSAANRTLSQGLLP